MQGKGFSREDRGAREGVLKGGVYGGFSRGGGGVLFEILDNYELLLKPICWCTGYFERYFHKISNP